MKCAIYKPAVMKSRVHVKSELRRARALTPEDLQEINEYINEPTTPRDQMIPEPLECPGAPKKQRTS